MKIIHIFEFSELSLHIESLTKEAKAEIQTSSNCRNYNKQMFNITQNFTKFFMLLTY